MFRCLVQCTVKIIVQLLYWLLSIKETHEHHDSFKRLCREATPHAAPPPIRGWHFGTNQLSAFQGVHLDAMGDEALACSRTQAADGKPAILWLSVAAAVAKHSWAQACWGWLFSFLSANVIACVGQLSDCRSTRLVKNCFPWKWREVNKFTQAQRSAFTVRPHKDVKPPASLRPLTAV